MAVHLVNYPYLKGYQDSKVYFLKDDFNFTNPCVEDDIVHALIETEGTCDKLVSTQNVPIVFNNTKDRCSSYTRMVEIIPYINEAVYIKLCQYYMYFLHDSKSRSIMLCNIIMPNIFKY